MSISVANETLPFRFSGQTFNNALGESRGNAATEILPEMRGTEYPARNARPCRYAVTAELLPSRQRANYREGRGFAHCNVSFSLFLVIELIIRAPMRRRKVSGLALGAFAGSLELFFALEFRDLGSLRCEENVRFECEILPFSNRKYREKTQYN